jgi:DASH complex subunit SPC19
LPESALTDAQTALHDEIAPEVTQLLQRVETHLAKMERHEQALVAKAELQEGRLEQHAASRAGKDQGDAFGAIAGTGEKAERLRALRAKKERLTYTVQRLNLQAGHKVYYGSTIYKYHTDLAIQERQLRMSMAAQ